MLRLTSSSKSLLIPPPAQKSRESKKLCACEHATPASLQLAFHESFHVFCSCKANRRESMLRKIYIVRVYVSWISASINAIVLDIMVLKIYTSRSSTRTDTELFSLTHSTQQVEQRVCVSECEKYFSLGTWTGLCKFFHKEFMRLIESFVDGARKVVNSFISFKLAVNR